MKNSLYKVDLLERELCQASFHVKHNECLAPYTTMKIGGSANLFVIAQNILQLETAIKLASKYSIHFLVIGNGSNIIVSDSGYEGLVILNNANRMKILSCPLSSIKRKCTDSRFAPFDNSYYSNSVFQYSDEDTDDVAVRADSGMKISILMKELFKVGITGLQWFSGIPSTVGGAIYMNMHGGHHYFGDLVEKALLYDGKNTREVDNDYFQFDYDWSILHQTGEIILQADLHLKKGNVQKAKELARKWAAKKSHHPQRSAGCIFRNLTIGEQTNLNLPTPSVGYLIDQVLNLKGTRIGDAVISPKHAAFIENLGEARTQDVVELIDLIIERAKSQLKLDLKMEVKLIGKF